MPTQKLKSGSVTLSSQEIGSNLVSFGMIFQALQSELFRLKFAEFKYPENPGIQPTYK